MPDKEKVIKGLEVCFDSSKECNGCPYITTPYCKTTLRNDVTALLKEQKGLMLALEQSNAVNGYLNAEVKRLNGLLKEQEAVKPKYNARTNWYECGNCHYSMTSGMHCRSELIPATKVRYCANCGFPVNWEGW